MIERAVQRPLGTLALWAALAAAGVWQLLEMPVTLLPEAPVPDLVVRAEWPGVTPETLESTVTRRLEAAARAVLGVQGVRSVSQAVPGGGSAAEVELEVARGASLPHVRLAVAERLRSVARAFPDGVDLRLAPGAPAAVEGWSRPLLELHLAGLHTAAGLTALARARVRPVLLSEPGVREVRVLDGAEPRRLIVPGRLRAAGRGISGRDVAASVRRAPPDWRSLGTLDVGDPTPVLLRGSGTSGPPRLAGTLVSGADTGPASLGDVAAIRTALAPPRRQLRVRGRPAVSMQVLAEDDVRAYELGARLRHRLAALGPDLPAGVEIGIDGDSGRQWRAIAAEGARRGGLGLVLVGLVVLLAVQRARGAAVVLLAAAVSTLAAVFVVGIRGGRLDLFTLSGLLWGLGLTVDNALVVADLARGAVGRGFRPRSRAALAAARDASPALAAGTATTICGLAAVAAARTELLPWLVSFAEAAALGLVASLGASLTLVPAALAMDRGGDRIAGVAAPLRRFRRHTFRTRARAAAARLLSFLAGRACAVLLVAHLLLGLAGWIVHQHVRRLPRWDVLGSGPTSVVVDMRLERGSDARLMDGAARVLESRLTELGAPDYRTRVEPAWARITVPLDRGGEGALPPSSVMAEMVAAASELDGVDARVTGLGPGFRTPGTRAADYAVELTGHRYRELRAVAERLAATLRADRRVAEVDPLATDPWHRRSDRIERVVELDGHMLAAARITAVDAARRLAPAFRPWIPVGRSDVDSLEVRVETGPLARTPGRRPRGARSAVVELPLADRLPFRRIVREGTRRVPPGIDRVDGRYRSVLRWRYAGPRRLGDRLREELLATEDLPEGYRVRRLRDPDHREQAGDAVRRGALAGAAAMVLVVVAILDSWRIAFTALLVIPASLVGSGLALLVADVALTPAAWAGAALTLGVAVNGGILVAHRAGELARGDPPAVAAVTATLQRLSPVLATGASSVAGLVPFVLVPSDAGSELWTALGVSSIGGVVAGTVAAVTLVPVALAWGPRGRMTRG